MAQGGEEKYVGGGQKTDGVDNGRAASGATRTAEGRKRSADPMRRADAPPAALDSKVQDQLGRVFRGFCDDLVNQPIPDKFSVLLARLEAKQREKE